MLFNIYADRSIRMLNIALSELPIFGVTINGRTLNKIRYADNAAVLTDNDSNLQILLDEANKVRNNMV